MSTSFLVFLCFSTLLAFSQAEGYIGYKIYEITPATDAQCALLAELAKQDQIYDFFTISKLPAHPARVMVPPQTTAELELYLQQHKMAYTVLNENVGVTIEREFEVNRLLRKLSPNSTGKGRLSTTRYYTHAEISNYIDDLAVRFPARVFVKTFGKSYEGRLMKTIKITNGDGRINKNAIFMDGGFHAREWISPAAVLYVIEQLIYSYAENAELLKDYDWIILPVVNPDGYEYTQTSKLARLWRKTRQPHMSSLGVICYGADPNRNFDFHWNEEGASSVPCSDTYAGPHAFSEKETVVVRDIMHTLQQNGVMYLTIHSHGYYLLYPWGWTSDLPETWQDLHEVANAGAVAIKEATGTNYTVGSSTNVLYAAAGASDDYGFVTGFPISITMELPSGGLTGFDPPASRIDEFVKETWIGIRAMGKKVVHKYPIKS